MDRALVAQLVVGAREQDLNLAGENGLLGQVTKLVLESALEGEITEHTQAELAEFFGVTRSTGYRAIQRESGKRTG